MKVIRWIACCFAAAFIGFGIWTPALEGPTFQVESKQPKVAVGTLVGPITAELAAGFELFLDDAQKSGVRAVVVGIASPGGDFIASKKIFDAIKASSIPVHCYVQGMAASGAFWALQACTTRTADPKTMLMAHGPSATFTGRVVVSKAEAYFLLEQLIGREAVMVHDIAERMGMTEDAMIRKFNEGDWVMVPSEALELKAIDAIESKGFGAYLETIVAKYRNLKWPRN